MSQIPPSGMPPRAKLILHSFAAAMLMLAVMIAVTWLGYYFAGVQGVRGRDLFSWQLVAFAVGLVAGLAAFFGYRRWLLGAQPDQFQDQQSGFERENYRILRDAQDEALRVELRATPGLERYAALVGKGVYSMEVARQREMRIGELRGNPVKERYIERVFNGETITDRMIAYWEAPAVPMLCSHLAALEQEVRVADPGAHPTADRVLSASLDFDFDAVKVRYRLEAAPVTFWHRPFGPEFYGRAEEMYDGLERIECTEHRCVLEGSSEQRQKFPAAA
jgi:hypothetical protein